MKPLSTFAAGVQRVQFFILLPLALRNNYLFSILLNFLLCRSFGMKIAANIMEVYSECFND